MGGYRQQVLRSETFPTRHPSCNQGHRSLDPSCTGGLIAVARSCRLALPARPGSSGFARAPPVNQPTSSASGSGGAQHRTSTPGIGFGGTRSAWFPPSGSLLKHLHRSRVQSVCPGAAQSICTSGGSPASPHQEPHWQSPRTGPGHLRATSANCLGRGVDLRPDDEVGLEANVRTREYVRARSHSAPPSASAVLARIA